MPPSELEYFDDDLLLAGLISERPEIDAEFAAMLDARVARGFARPAGAAGGRAVRRVRLVRWPMLAAPVGALAAAVVAVVLVTGAGGSGDLGSRPVPVHAVSTAASSAAVTSAASGSAGTPQSGNFFGNSGLQSLGPLRGAPAASAPVRLPANGHRTITGARLDLTASGDHIEQVAQQIYDIVGAAGGSVERSQVTASADNPYASFQLGIPSAQLPETMAALSRMRFAAVASRTDNSQDVQSGFDGAQRRLAEDRATRAALLRQLAAASLQSDIDALHGRIASLDAAITADEAALRSLQGQVSVSQVSVTINPPPPTVPVAHHAGGFTLRTATHDAGRVLSVAAGAALIAGAALLPLALVAALAAWARAGWRHRGRERALDAAA